MNDNIHKNINYSYGYARDTYDQLKPFEISLSMPALKPSDCIIVRLDGKGLTSRFKNDKDLFIADFHLAMKRVCENIHRYLSYVQFVYSFKDEISLLLNKEKFFQDKEYNSRIEKVLPTISGYVSAMFSQYIPKRLKNSPTEAFTFDARLVVLPTAKLKDYFHARQAFAMSGFIDRICAFKKLNVHSHTFSNVKNALIEINDDWYNYPQYVSSGYVGCYINEKWKVETASDFAQKWYKYEPYMGA